MSFIVTARNVNHAFSQGLQWLLTAGKQETSRNGTVLVAPGPVLTVYKRPTERVLFLPERDANPFFHLMESIWMLAGKNDLEFPRLFNSKFGAYSDDGVRLHGAYGHRWRKHFDRDQLVDIQAELLSEGDSRRAVLGMWDPREDLPKLHTGGRDVPCNTHAYFDLRGGALNMTVCNRSNDVIWGAYGANVVHFSVLQEYLAATLGVAVGEMRQFSNNFHLYTSVYPIATAERFVDQAPRYDFYSRSEVVPYPLVASPTEFLADCERFVAHPTEDGEYANPFFDDVAYPMYEAWRLRKEGAPAEAIRDIVSLIQAPDWKLACAAWIGRRG